MLISKQLISFVVLTIVFVVVNADEEDTQSSSSSSSEKVTCSAEENLVYDSCFNGCEESCDNREYMCAQDCKPGGGCRCAEGYARESSAPDAPCVPKKQCNHCKANEVFAECDWGKCQSYCNYAIPKDCYKKMEANSVCIKGSGAGTCVCKSGFIRTDSITCVPKSQCPEWRKKFGYEN